MKEFIFVSDFDGTMTHKDFYHIVIDKYLTWGKDYYTEWKKTKAIDLFFLNKIFNSINLTEDELLKDILEIPFDDSVLPFIEKIKAAGGEFVILSAGTSYYIDIILKRKGLADIKVISNTGIYKDGGITLLSDDKSLFYSELFGIDKGIAIKEFKKEYKKVYYAGDSEPDVSASLNADLVFAKPGLQELLAKENKFFVPYTSYDEVEKYMIEKGLI